MNIDARSAGPPSSNTHRDPNHLPETTQLPSACRTRVPTPRHKIRQQYPLSVAISSTSCSHFLKSRPSCPKSMTQRQDCRRGFVFAFDALCLKSHPSFPKIITQRQDCRRRFVSRSMRFLQIIFSLPEGMT